MSTIKLLARIATDWARRCFGDDHVSNLQIRSLRNLEETTELAQAIGLSRDSAVNCIHRVYDRPVGEIEQELGGTLLTAVVLCEAMGHDPEELLEREVRRVLQKSPDHFAKRNQEKIDSDAQAQKSSDPEKKLLGSFLQWPIWINADMQDDSVAFNELIVRLDAKRQDWRRMQ